MFLLIAFTIFISFPKTPSLLPSNFKSSVYSKRLIFLSVPCTSHYYYNYYYCQHYTAAVSKLYYMVSCPRVTIKLCP
jgi:hypothetical protein